MIYALVEYINKNGRITVKGFSTKEETEKFVARLKTEYIVTVMNRGE